MILMTRSGECCVPAGRQSKAIAEKLVGMMRQAALHLKPLSHSSSCVSSADIQLKAVWQLLEGHVCAALDDQMQNAI